MTSFDHFVMACEGIFMLFIVYYTIEEFLEIKRNRLKYFKSFWNILDILVIFLGYVAVLFNVYRTVVVGDLLKNLLQDSSQYANFDTLGFYQVQFNNMVAVAVFFAWIKVRSFVISLFIRLCTYFVSFDAGHYLCLLLSFLRFCRFRSLFIACLSVCR